MKKSKFPKTRSIPEGEFENRFQRFYYLHRPAINKHRRELYKQRKENGQCVKCGEPVCENSVFCHVHRDRSRVQRA